MNILITGANGQVGRELAVCLKNKDHTLLLTDIDQLDVSRKEEVERFFLGQNIHLTVNCAGYTKVDQAEEETELAELANAVGPANLREVSARFGTWLIHISTDYVFDGNSHRPYQETDTPHPISVYGRSKLGGEQAIKKYKRGVILRTSWLYSRTGTNFVRTILENGRQKPVLRVVNDQVGTPTLASDLALVIREIVERIRQEPEKMSPGIYHYSNEGVASWYDFAWEIARLAKLPCRVLPVPTSQYLLPAPRPHYSVLSKEKIKMALGVTIPHWKESLENFMKTAYNY
jgi:dTDP-4-dehydrorhamnose reductase